MSLNNRNVGRKAWNILRLSLLWARKSAVFRRKLATELRLVPKYLKRLGHTNTPDNQIHYFERELSFDETPMFNVKMYRPSSMRFHLPCISSRVDFDYDFNDDDIVQYDNGRNSDIVDAGDHGHEHDYVVEACQEMGFREEVQESCVQGIDKRADEFIAKFHQQMRLQRQISLLQYNKETPSRDTN
ncbi:uncharacterized protein LOC131629183 [Vicia villosa]|uniref:uncharacterized protein LOC131629183 n=1 Tax=Vicia villosa TaxID=3911 RepID=UPI00273B2AC7|nr:uncharacterized protein LOC131629183 [Vicia villosa]